MSSIIVSVTEIEDQWHCQSLRGSHEKINGAQKLCRAWKAAGCGRGKFYKGEVCSRCGTGEAPARGTAIPSSEPRNSSSVPTEVEVDAICDGNEVLIPGIMEHIERAGVHSGDSIAVYPPRNLSESVIKTIIDYTNRMALGLEVKGMINIQYIVRNNEVYVIEVNPRSSRTVPFLSKVTNVPMINVATKAAMGHSLREQGYKPGLGFFPDYYAVKAPVFSFNKMSNVDITLGPEMKSTGEVMCVDYQYSRALYKACIASGINVPHEGSILITVADMDKPEAAEIAAGFADLGYEIMATGGTAEYLKEKGVKVTVATKVSEGSPNILDDIKEGRISMVINTTNHGRDAERDGFKIRRSTVEHAIACLTSMDTARELQHVMSAMRRRRVVSIVALQDLAWEG